MHATTPTNVTAFVGTTLKLGCETDTRSPIRWDFDSPQSKHPLVLFNGLSVHGIVSARMAVKSSLE